MNQIRIVISRIPVFSIVALMFMLIGIIVLSISLSSFFDKIVENIFLDYGFFSIRFLDYGFFSIRFLKNKNFILY